MCIATKKQMGSFLQGFGMEAFTGIGSVRCSSHSQPFFPVKCKILTVDRCSLSPISILWAFYLYMSLGIVRPWHVNYRTFICSSRHGAITFSNLFVEFLIAYSHSFWIPTWLRNSWSLANHFMILPFPSIGSPVFMPKLIHFPL